MRLFKSLRSITISLFLFISLPVFPQVRIEIEGEGLVRVREQSFEGSGQYILDDIDKEQDTVEFRIKPGKQFYLDCLLIRKRVSRDTLIQVSRDSIYAERDDTLHYYWYGWAEAVDTFRFVFREVQPWDGETAVAYKSWDKLYMQIYRPEELFDSNFSSEVSLQNNLDLAHKGNWKYQRVKAYNSIIRGNDKILRNLYLNMFISVAEVEYERLNIIDGDDAMASFQASFREITTNSPPFYSFMYPARVSFLFRNCINFGDYYRNDEYFFYGVFEIIRTSKNLINWGSGSNRVCLCYNLGTDSADRHISNVFNFGRFPQLVSISGNNGHEGTPGLPPISFTYFNDKNLVPDIELPTEEWAKGYNLESHQLIDSAFMRGLMGDSAGQDFIFENGFYPRLRHMDERPGRLAASPILLYPGENADSVTLPFYVDTNYGVRWRSMNEDVIRIEGNVGYVRHPVLKDTTVRVEAWKEDFSKHVYLDVPASRYVYQDLRSDTVCPGDSVLMVRSYARNEGWNYEVVRTDTARYDTIYRMYLHHHPTYREVVHRAAVERDSLPYIHGRDTIRQFGLTEVGRYLTVHGCDSIEYVRLDTLYIHRERHFYDTLRACGHAQLSRPGMVIVVLQTSDFVDTVFDPNRGGTDSIQHLHVEIYPLPVYQSLYTDSCYIEQLPYTVGGRPIQDFGRTTVPLLTEYGCDSTVSYDLRRRWRYYRVSVETRGSGTASVGDTTLREDGSLWLTLTASACHRLDSLRVNGADVPVRERYLLENLRGDCFVEAVFSPSGPGEGALTLDVCADSLPVVYNGREYGAGDHEVRLHTATGCDSVVHLRVVGRENTATLSVRDTIEPPCRESVIGLAYTVESGSPRSLRVSFDAAARAAGFRDTALAIGGGGRVLLPLPEDVEPGRYGLVLYQADGSGCYAQAGSLAFEVRYPSDIIVQKWDDVLAVLSPEYNGGYAFSGYQWYRNGKAVEGATSAYYTPGRYLRYGDEYAVLLERASDGLRLLSCVYKARRAPGAAVLQLAPNPSRAGEGVRATVEDRPESSGHMEVYDGMGRRIYRAAFERGTHLLRIDTPGTYLVRAVSADGRWTASGKMVVM